MESLHPPRRGRETSTGRAVPLSIELYNRALLYCSHPGGAVYLHPQAGWPGVCCMKSCPVQYDRSAHLYYTTTTNTGEVNAQRFTTQALASLHRRASEAHEVDEGLGVDSSS